MEAFKQKLPVVVNYGGGTNSTALLVELVRKGLRPDYIFFADTGSERPETYSYLPKFSKYLGDNGFPKVNIVRWIRKRHPFTGKFVALHEWCKVRYELPSAAFGFKGCTSKWKAQPIDKEIKKIGKVVRLMGFDADEKRRHKEKDPLGNQCFSPLIEWGWGREECVETIVKAGLPLPGKSSCWMCPHMRRHEIIELSKKHPNLYEEALQIETNWKERTKREGSSIKGLGRRMAWADIDISGESEQDLEDNTRPCGCWD